MAWFGLPSFLYQIKSAPEKNWLLQIARNRKWSWEAGAGKGNQKISSGPAQSAPCLIHCLQLCPVLSTSGPTYPFPGSWHVRLKGTEDVVKPSTTTPSIQPVFDTSRDGNFATSPGNQLILPLTQLKSASFSYPHWPTWDSPLWGRPSDALVSRLTSLPPPTPLPHPRGGPDRSRVSQKLTNAKEVSTGTSEGRKCWEQRAVSGPFPCQGDALGSPRCLLQPWHTAFPPPACPVPFEKSFPLSQLTLLLFAKMCWSIFKDIMKFYS